VCDGKDNDCDGEIDEDCPPPDVNCVCGETKPGCEKIPASECPPPGCDPEILKRLRQMYEAGGWVLVESAIADLPADLRWLFESGAVTIEQLGALQRQLGITAIADIIDAVGQQKVRGLPGLDANVEAAIAAALPSLRGRTPRIPLGRAVSVAELGRCYCGRRAGAGRRAGTHAPATDRT
jgi:DNA polymerase/3'-5' exonuclease PolX